MIQALALSVENMTQFRTALTWAIMHTNIDIVKILAPLSSTPIYYATLCQSKEIVKFLSSLTKTPNAADINE